MNKVYLLLSFIIFVLVITMTYDASEVKSYVDGNLMLKVYCNPDGTIFKREYYVNGIISRTLEYQGDMISTERIYNEEGKKITVNQFDNNKIIKSTRYRKGIIPIMSGNQETETIV